jgi:2-dehydropantoate 2-reductase
VVVLQNGVEQRALVKPYVAGATVLPAVVWMATEATAPGHVRVVAPPRFVLPAEPATATVAGLLDGVETAADFTTQAWRKLAVNAVAGLMALSGRRAAMFRRDDARRLGRALAAEALTVARAEGADLPDAVADEIMDWFAELPEDAGTSILADREAGRPLEWDARNGVIARLGAAHGIPTPVSDVIVPLLAAASGDAGEQRH